MFTSELVGRDVPLRRLSRALDEAAAGMGRLVLISGEPGVGKTALAAAALAEAERRGARTATGVCWDGAGAPGLWPWVQVLRTLRSAVGRDVWNRATGSGHEALTRLIDADQPPTVTTVPFHVFDSVLQLIEALAATAAVVLLLEDVQWADGASVQLLEFLQHHASHLPLLLLATYRADELARPDHPQRDAVAHLAQNAVAISLAGLDNAGIQQLRSQLGVTTTLAEAEQLRRLTGGNPFFVIESTAYTSPSESLGVQRAVDHRIDALGDSEREVLTVGSVVGRTVPDAVLAAVVGDHATAALAAITRAGLMRADHDTHSFVHDLVREAVRDRLSTDERRAIHAAIVRAATAPEAGAALLPPQLAWHATEAVPEIPADLAVELLESAALDASAHLTHEAAGRHLETAAELAARRQERIRLTLASGLAYLRGGELAQARDRFTSLLEESPEVRARALLGLHSLGEEAAGSSLTGVVRGLDEVDDVLGPDTDTALRAEVLAARSRSRAHLLADDRAEATRMAADALELARAAEDDHTLAACLLARHDAIWEPGTEHARLTIASELTQVGRRLHEPEVEAQGLLLAMVAQLELGDPGFRHTHRRFDEVAEASGSQRLRFWAGSRRGTIATLDAEFGRAVAEIDAARDLGSRIGESDASSVWCDQRWQVARHQGDAGAILELAELLRRVGDPHWVVYETLIAVEAGDVERAELGAPEVEVLGERWPRWAARLWLTFLAQMAILRDDHAAIDSLIETLTPDADCWAVLGGGVIVDGPLSLWLGRLEQARGDHERAATWFAQAEASALRLGSHLWTVEARSSRLATDHELGAATTSELASVLREAEQLGLNPVARRLRSLTTGASPNIFRLDHDVWTLAWNGREVQMPDAKGLGDLHTLVANPGVEISAADLATGGTATATSTAPVLDQRAKDDYRRRLDELDDAIDRATLRQHHDQARQLETEREALLDELRRATGLGGRDRRLNDEAEKMRKTVTARIRDTLRKLDDRNPQMAAHLRESVRTGARCSYNPPEVVAWDL